MRRVEQTPDVDVDGLIPLVHTAFQHGGEGHDAGVIDEHVHATQLLQLLADAFSGSAVGHVERLCMADSASLRDLVCQCHNALGAASGENYLRSVFREELRR